MEIKEEKLRRLYSDFRLSQKEIAKIFGLTPPYISKKLSKFGIETRNSNRWTDEDIKFLEGKLQVCGKERVTFSASEMILERS